MDEPISFADLKQQHADLEGEIAAAIRRVFDAGRFVLGRESEAFEAEFAAFCGASHCVGCASGTDALALALQGLGVGPGDEVIVPAFTFFATAQAVIAAGATPVFADVHACDALIDPAHVAELVTRRTRAIVAVHLFGQVCDMRPLLELAQRHDLRVVEDAAQAHGATREGQRAGTFGDAAAFSFYPGKNLGACGDGGAVVTHCQKLDQWLRMARQHGSKRKFEHLFVGKNSRLDELQAAILRVKLRRLEGWNERRTIIARAYDDALSSLPVRALTSTPGSVRHLYVVRTARRDEVLARMHERGIQCAVHYPSLAARQPALRHLHGVSGALDNGLQLCDEVLSLPIYPELTDAGVERVAGALRSSVRVEH